MPWLHLIINSSRQSAETIEEALLDSGAVSVTFEDNADQPILEPALGETPLWQQTRITGLFDAGISIDEVTHLLAAQLGSQLPDYRWSPLEDRDWEREWMQHYQPIRCGKHLWICPSWLAPPEPSSINMLLDPGLAFGTGTHPTTFLCLQWLDGIELAGKTVTDYGCGSGILAIAALLLGADSATCIDIDHQALLATTDNALRNKLAPEKVLTYLPEQAPPIATDLVIANILAGPLVSLAPKLNALTLPGGALCLSGIIDTQADEVMSAYAPWFDFAHPASREQWVRLTAIKR